MIGAIAHHTDAGEQIVRDARWIAGAFAETAHRATDGQLPVKVVGDAAELLSAATGLVLSTYTGVLLGATAIPVWSRNARVRPLHFGASGLGTATAMLELLGHRTRALNRIGIGAALVETPSVPISRSATALATPRWKAARPQRSRATAGVLAGPLPLALRLLASRSPTARRLAAASTIAGSLLTRLAWVRAGRE